MDNSRLPLERRLSTRVDLASSQVNKNEDTLKQIEKHVGRFFIENMINLNAVGSPSFHEMIKSILESAQSRSEIQTYEDLEGRMLKNAIEEMRQYVDEIRSSWATTGCSILLDLWIDSHNRHLMNVLVDCPRGTVYLQSAEISALIGNVEAMQEFLDAILDKVVVKNVVQIIAPSTSTCMDSVVERLMDKHKAVFWTVSASHCLELMLEKFLSMNSFQDIIGKAKVITRFIYQHRELLKLMKSRAWTGDFVQPHKTRSLVPFMTLENIGCDEERIKMFLSSSEWTTSCWASTRDGETVTALVADDSFWKEVKTIIYGAMPIVSVLVSMNDDNEVSVGHIYEEIDRAKELIKDNFKGEETRYMPYWDAIDGIWNTHLHSHLHSAGYYLNPRLVYSNDFCYDEEVESGLHFCIDRMSGSDNIRRLIAQQTQIYYQGKGSFAQGRVNEEDLLNLSPAKWWEVYGVDCPELQQFAVRILSQTCNGASKCNLRRDMAEMLFTEGINPIKQQRLSDKLSVLYNLNLKNDPLGRTYDDENHQLGDWGLDL